MCFITSKVNKSKKIIYGCKVCIEKIVPLGWGGEDLPKDSQELVIIHQKSQSAQKLKCMCLKALKLKYMYNFLFSVHYKTKTAFTSSSPVLLSHLCS